MPTKKSKRKQNRNSKKEERIAESRRRLDALNNDLLTRLRMTEATVYIPQTCPNPTCGIPMKFCLPEDNHWLCMVCGAQTLNEPPVPTDLDTYNDIMENLYGLTWWNISAVMLVGRHVSPEFWVDDDDVASSIAWRWAGEVQQLFHHEPEERVN